MVEVEQSTQPLGFSNGPVLTKCSLVGEGDDIIESLMITFVLMVGKIFIERMAQGTLAKENQLIETFILHGTHPPFREGVEIGRLWWKFERLNACGAENGIKALREFGIAVVYQEAGVGHGTFIDGQVTGDLF